MMNTSVQSLSNLLLREACKALDSDAIQEMLKAATITATGVVVSMALEVNKPKAKRKY
jgi:hypothetical protein